MNKQQRFFRVKYGFQASDQVSINESELDKAILAQLKGIPVQLGLSYINGRNIISISPHWHKHTGWFDWYEPKNGDDWQQIKRDCPDYTGIIEAHKNIVFNLIQKGQEMMIENNEIPKEIIESEIEKVKGLENRKIENGGMLSIGDIIKK